MEKEEGNVPFSSTYASNCRKKVLTFLRSVGAMLERNVELRINRLTQ
jgi:hypothetical protein